MPLFTAGTRNSSFTINLKDQLPRLSQFVAHTAPFRALYRYTSKVHPHGFQGLSLYTVGRHLIKEIRVNKLNVRGAAVTYNFFMAIPPTLLFLCSLIPYLPIQGFQESIILGLRTIRTQPQLTQYAEQIITDFLTVERRDVLSIGILFTLFFSSNGMMGLMRSFDRQSQLYKRRGAFKRRWTAIKLTILVLIVTIIALSALILQTKFIDNQLRKVFSNPLPLQLVSLFIVVMLVFFCICMIYKYGPSLTHKWPFISPGAILATIGCVLLTTVFFFLVDNVIHYNKVYGSIGTLMAFMVWMFLNIQVILLGFELNVSIVLGKLAEEKHVKFEESRHNAES